MKRSWTNRVIVFSSVLALGTAVTSFASCATTAEATDEDDAASPVAESGAMPAIEASVSETDRSGAGCDASDPGCTTEVVPCSRVSWCLVPTPVSPAFALTAVWGTRKDDVWAVGSGGTIIHYDGAGWIATPSGYPNTFHAIWGSGPRDIWVVSSADVVLHGRGLRNGEAAWQNVPPVSSSTTQQPLSGIDISTVWGTSANDVRLGTRNFVLFVSTMNSVFNQFTYSGQGNQFVKSMANDGGVVWRGLPGKEFAITSIWGSSADDVWMTVDNGPNVPFQRGVTFHGTPYDASTGGPNPYLKEDPNCYGCTPGCIDCAIVDDPLGWTPVDSQTTGTLESVWGSSASDVWTVGAEGTIRHIATGDARWQKVESPTTETLHAVWGTGPDDIWMVGDNATILHYDGTKFENSSAQLPLGPRPQLRGIWGSSRSDVWIVGDTIALHYTGPKADAGEGSGVR